jgi:hypothetical protein
MTKTLYGYTLATVPGSSDTDGNVLLSLSSDKRETSLGLFVRGENFWRMRERAE